MDAIGGIFSKEIRKALKNYGETICANGWRAGEPLIGEYAFNFVEPSFPKYCLIMRILLRADELTKEEGRAGIGTMDDILLIIEAREILKRLGRNEMDIFLNNSNKNTFEIGLIMVFLEVANIDVRG